MIKTRTERRDTERECRESIAGMAKVSFSEHVIEAKDTNRWRCGKPGTSMYAFNVVIVPGHVFVYGDVGDAVLRCSYREVGEIIGWLRGANRDYLCGKLLFKEAFRQFYADDAVDWFRDYVKSNEGDWKDLLEDVERMSEHGDLNEYEWHELMNREGLDGDAHRAGIGLSSGAFWTVECLHKFVELFDAQA